MLLHAGNSNTPTNEQSISSTRNKTRAARKATLPRPKQHSADGLIEAHKKSLRRFRAAEAALHRINHPDRASVTIIEGGPRCVAYDLKDIDRISNEIRTAHGLTGIQTINFNSRVAKYREALAIMIRLHEEWRETAGVNQIDQEYNDAYDAVDVAFRGLLGHLKASPEDSARIVQYLAKMYSQGGEMWQWRITNVLMALADGLRDRKSKTADHSLRKRH